MADLKERIVANQTARRTRTQREEAAIEAASKGPGAPKKKKKAKKKPAPAVGTGTSSFDLDGAIAKIRAQMATSQDPEFKARLQRRIQMLKDNQ